MDATLHHLSTCLVEFSLSIDRLNFRQNAVLGIVDTAQRDK